MNNNNYTTTSKTGLRKLTAAICLTLLACFATINLNAQVTVNPGSGSYTTVSAAFTAINAGTHTGAITIEIASPGTTEPAAPTVLAASGVGSANYSSITIYPTASGVLVQGTSNVSRGILEFNGADNITINGNLNNGSGTTQDLTIRNNTVVTNAHSVLWFQGSTTSPQLGSTNIVIKNTILQGNGNSGGASGTTTYSTGIAFAGTTFPASTTVGANHQTITITNNIIKQVNTGIHIANASGTPVLNLLINQNQIGSATASEYVYFRGIWLAHVSGSIIRQNHIFNIKPSLTTQSLDRNGIEVTGASTSVLIERNEIHGIETFSSTGYAGFGINISTGVTGTASNHLIVNNLIYDIQGYGWNTQVNTPIGIRLGTGTGHKVYYNSVHLFGTNTGTGTTLRNSADLAVTLTTVTGLDIRNNIFSNKTTSPGMTTSEHIAVWFVAAYPFSTAGNTMNNNAYFVGSLSNHYVGKVGTTAGTGTYLNLAAWQSVSLADGQSIPIINLDAPFTSNTNLTIPAATSTGCESGGVAIASLGLPNIDFTGVNRPAGTGTAPDMGAYEFEGIAATGCNSAPANGGTASISSPSICTGATVTLTATGYTSDIGITYQWTQSPSFGGTYTPVSGATNPSGFTSAALTSDTYYRLEVTCSNTSQTTNSNVVSVSVTNPQILSTTPASLCGIGTVVLGATPSSGATINWYANQTGGSPLATGNSLTTPVISSTTNYWASASVGGANEAAGRSAPTTTPNTIGNAWGLVFNVVNTPITLQSVNVYSVGAAGSISVQLTNNAGTVLSTAGPFNFAAGSVATPTIVTLPVNFSVPVGTGYRILSASTGTGSLIRETSGITYPYTSASGNVVVTSGYIAGTTATTYYFFYNWLVSTGCESVRQMVTATVTSAPSISASSTQSLVCSGGNTILNVSSSNDPNYSYTWTPGNLTGASVSVNPASSTTYTVTALDNSGGAFNGCTTLSTVAITAQPSSATISSSPEGFCVNGGSATLSLVPASGYPANSIQWQYSPTGSGYTDIGGATSPTYVTPSISSDSYYKALIKDGNNAICLQPTYSLLINNPQLTGTTDGNRCGTGTVNLSATVSTGSTVNWYTAPTGGLPIGTGTSFTTPQISSTTTFYAAPSSGGANYNIGMVSTPVGVTPSSGVGIDTQGMLFDAYSSLTINTVTIYPNAAANGTAGTLTLGLYNFSSGALLQQTTVNVTGYIQSSNPTSQTITLNFNVPSGNGYKIAPISKTGISGLMFLPSASAPSGNWGYPYTIAGVASITSSALGTTVRPDLYYFFYNWSISTGCEGARQPVTATVIPAPPISVTSTYPAVCPGGSTDLVVTSVNDPDYTYSWTSIPAGFTASGAGPHTVAPIVTTKYYLNALDNSGGANQGCAMIDSVTVVNGGTLVAGTVSASQTSLCVSGSPTLTVAGASGGALQWQSSTISTSGPWTNVGTGTASYNPGTVTQTTHYQVVVSCNSSSLTSNVQTITVNDPQLTSTTPTIRCGAGPVTLGATSSGGTINWYANATGGAPLGTGTSFTTNIISDTVFYAAATSGGGGLSSVGPLNNSLGTGSVQSLTHYLKFTVLASSMTLQGVYVYPGAAGNVVLNISNSAGTVLTTITHAVSSSNVNQKTFIPVNYTINAGVDYRIGWATGGVSLYRNDAGYSYPYTLPSVVSITGNSFNAAYYYYCYDWQVVTGCEGTRVPVAVTATPAPLIAATAGTFVLCGGGSTTVSVSSSNDPNYTYSWTSTPAGFTATGPGPHNVSVPATTTFNVTAIDNTGGANAGCGAIDFVTVNAVANPLSLTATSTPPSVCPGNNAQLNTTATVASDANNYSFTALGGTFSPISGGTATSIAATADEAISTAFNIGFSFNFAGSTYTTVQATSNGALLFGSGKTNSLTNNLATTTATQRPGVAPLWDDLQCSSGVKYVVTGSPGSQVLTVEWLNMEWYFTSSTTVISFQVKLFEGTNTIQFIYQDAGNPPAGSVGASIGIMGVAYTDFISLQDVSAAPAISTTISNNSITTKPANGQIYQFTPPIAGPVTYDWTLNTNFLSATNIPNPVAQAVTSPQTYIVVITQTSTGCTKSATVSVALNPEPVPSASSNAPVCVGSTLSLFGANLASGQTSGNNWLWSGPSYSSSSQNPNLSNASVTMNGTYTLTVTNNFGCTSSATTSVTVNPNPVLSVASVTNASCIGEVDGCIDIDATSGTAPYLFDYNGNSTLDGIYCGLGAGTYFVTVIDDGGCESNISASVIEEDLVDPEINCIPDVMVNNTPNLCSGVATWVGPVGTDNCAGSTTLQSGGPASGSTFPVGITPITYTVTDVFLNTATCSFNVIVVDNQDPVITCPANIAINITPNLCTGIATWIAPVGTDNCSGAITAQTGGLSSGSSFPVGTSLVTYTVTDAASNTATCSFNVVVSDNENPTILCPPTVTVNSDIGVCYATNVTLGNPTYGDNCGGVLTIANNAPAQYPVGGTYVQWEVTDLNSNKSSCNQLVIVQDHENPVALCKNICVYLNSAGTATITGADIDNGSHDNCSIQSLTASPSSFTYANAGANTVTLTVLDINGNSSTCTSTITVGEYYTLFGSDNNCTASPGGAANCLVNISNGSSVTGNVGSYRLVQTGGSVTINGKVVSGGKVSYGNSVTSGSVSAANLLGVPGNIFTTGSGSHILGDIDVSGNINVNQNAGSTVTGTVRHPAGTTYTGPVPGGGVLIAAPVLPALPGMPAIHSYSCGGANISGSAILNPGSYGNLVLGNAAGVVVTFNGPGNYYFSNINLSQGGIHTFKYDFLGLPGNINIYVCSTIHLGQIATQWAGPNTPDACRVYFEVQGNGINIIGLGSQFYGRMWAPYSGIDVGGGSCCTYITGSLWSGQKVNLNGSVTVTACGSPCPPAPKIGEETTTTNVNMNDMLQVYPNPTSGKTTVRFFTETPDNYTLKVMDYQGRVVLSNELKATEGDNTQEIDMSGFAKGLYLIEVGNNDHSQKVRVVVQ